MVKFSNEFLLPHVLTNIQHQVLVGSLLGDGSLELPGKFPRMKIGRQIKDHLYLEWEYSLFQDLCKSGIKTICRYDSRYNKAYKHVYFQTRAVPAFLNYYHQWYPNGKKTVPKDLKLTSLILAVWFADDGCIIRKNNHLTLKIATDGFGFEGANRLSQKLEQRYSCKFPIYQKQKNKDLWFIKTSTRAAQPFIKDIAPHIEQMGMSRKSDLWKSFDLNTIPIAGRMPNKEAEKQLYKAILKLQDFSVNKLVSLADQYDINTLRSYLNDFIKDGYLIRYEGSEKWNLYHYKMTNTGKNFFREVARK